MRLVTLVDNRQGDDASFLTEHGLSFFIETNHTKILLDVGASSGFLTNAQQLHIDIANVDILILSHAHADHTGGLAAFLQHNSKAKIYVSSHISEAGYFSTRRGCKRNISINFDLLREHSDRFIMLSGNADITPNVKVIADIPSVYPRPVANATLLEGDTPDQFNHEMAVLVTENGKSALLSSCCHLGLLNTLSSCPSDNIATFVGGLHLIDSDEQHTYESPNDIAKIAEVVRSNYPHLEIHTGHCTGAAAIAQLTQLLAPHFHTFYSGLDLNLLE